MSTIATTNIKLKINTSDVIGEDTILEETNALIENNHPPFYKFCVLNWNDVNDEFQTVEDIFNKNITPSLSAIDIASSTSYSL